MTSVREEKEGMARLADDPAVRGLIAARSYFTRAEVSGDQRALFLEGGRDGDVFYRNRWSHDRVVRSTHGVNCTGSCSWKVYVKDGIITWETQQTDYPSVGADSPEYEPRGCARGASYSWYLYSANRVKYPLVRARLLKHWEVDLEAGKVTLKHGDIKSLDMPAMTMVFVVKDRAMLDKLKTGDKVRFKVINDGGRFMLTEIQPAK